MRSSRIGPVLLSDARGEIGEEEYTKRLGALA